MSKTLRELQTGFLVSILENQSFSDKNNPVAVQDQDKNFYQEGIFSRLSAALAKIYPATRAIIGDEIFSLFAHQFIVQYPSNQINILNYGKLFNEFILFNQFDKYHLYLPDLTRLEWAWHCAYHGDNNTPPNIPYLADKLAQEQEKCVLDLPQNRQLLRLSYPVTKLWQEFQMDQAFSSINPELMFLQIWQQENKIRIETLTQDEYVLLRLIEKQMTIEEICAQYQTFHNKQNPSELLTSLCRRGCTGVYKE